MDRLTRRALLAGATATAAGALFLSRGKEKEAEKPKPQKEPETQAPPTNPEAFLDRPKTPRPYRMGNLTGVNVADLLSLYTIGEKRRLKETEQIDFKYQQAQLWKRKLEYVKTNRPGAYSDVRHGAEALFSSYDADKITSMTLTQYRNEADLAIVAVRKDTDIERIKRIPAFSDFKTSQLALLKFFEGRIGGDALMAYALTEIMPTKNRDARIGVEMFDFLLRNAGREFVDRIPALHDARFSVGAYQFTSDALYEVGNIRNGASRIQHTLLKDPKKRHIPGSVLELKGSTHHKAAYFFALDNLAMAVRQLGEAKAKKMLAQASNIPSELVAEYVAAAHHNPSYARKALLAYADELNKYTALPTDKRSKATAPDFLAHCQSTGKVGEYCEKTRSNLATLRARGS